MWCCDFVPIKQQVYVLKASNQFPTGKSSPPTGDGQGSTTEWSWNVCSVQKQVVSFSQIYTVLGPELYGSFY